MFAQNPQLLSDFIDVLVAAGVIEENDAKDVLRQPYKYENYFDQWKAAGYPLPESGEAWDSFEFVDEEEEEEEE